MQLDEGCVIVWLKETMFTWKICCPNVGHMTIPKGVFSFGHIHMLGIFNMTSRPAFFCIS